MSRLFAAASSHYITHAGPGGGYWKLSLSVWIYLSSQPANGGATYTIMANAGTPGHIGYRLFYYQTGGIKRLGYTSSLTGGIHNTVTIDKSLDSSQWYHIALTVDLSISPDNIKFYVNGVHENTNYTNLNPDWAINVIAGGVGTIGCFWDGSTGTPSSDFFDGRIAEPMVMYHHAISSPHAYAILTAAEVLSLYNGTKFDTIRSDPYEYEGAWKLCGFASPETDFSRWLRHATVFGATGADNPPTLTVCTSVFPVLLISSLYYNLPHELRYANIIASLGDGYEFRSNKNLSFGPRADGIGTTSTYKGLNSFKINLRNLRHVNTSTTTEANVLWDFYQKRLGGLDPFYFYNPIEAATDPTGIATVGRYLVRFEDQNLNREAFALKLYNAGIGLVEVRE